MSCCCRHSCLRSIVFGLVVLAVLVAGCTSGGGDATGRSIAAAPPDAAIQDLNRGEGDLS